MSREMPRVSDGAEEPGRLIGALTGRELEIVFYLAGLGIVLGLAVVAIGALLKLVRRNDCGPRR